MFCESCKIEKTQNDFYKNKSSRSGFEKTCKVCRSARGKINRETYVDDRDRSEYMKNYRFKNKDKASDYRKKYYQENKPKLLDQNKNWTKKNKEYLKEYSKNYREENREKINQHMVDTKKERRITKAAWHEKNKEKNNQRNKNWFKENPLKARVLAVKRRSRIKKDESFNDDDLKFIFKSQKGKCVCCNKSLKSGYHVDHIIPLSKGGSNCKKNIQLLYPTCNLQKHAKDPIEFMQERGFLL